jgi:hypothetical protein
MDVGAHRNLLRCPPSRNPRAKLHLDHPKHEKESRIRMWERIETPYDVLLKGIQEQNSPHPQKMVIFWSFRAQSHVKMKGGAHGGRRWGGWELPL